LFLGRDSAPTHTRLQPGSGKLCVLIFCFVFANKLDDEKLLQQHFHFFPP
jgi:hypothetical protein